MKLGTLAVVAAIRRVDAAARPPSGWGGARWRRGQLGEAAPEVPDEPLPDEEAAEVEAAGAVEDEDELLDELPSLLLPVSERSASRVEPNEPADRLSVL